MLSPSTRALDRGEKLGIYARQQAGHIWFVEPDARLIAVLRLDGDTYRIVQAVRGEAPARMEPFAAVEVDVAA